ncbi:DedA family protein [Cellulomonas uda]|uniref:Membrane protein n=1 Tax=Cellulomonas uda TaxID=1714 RepID=A0A4Y3KGH9_CELUD|nr:DedA family protein [Cellulomonas uda]NII65035.1 membrane protein DedA with SNARE-associated domain [Cellulomonas uda]GEA82030.1 membrane protein [Cellulomonas uda]
MGLEQWALDLAASPWIYLVMYLFAAIDGFFPPIPSESVVIALAALAVGPGGEPNLWVVVPVAALGAFTGDQIAFSIGRRVPVHRLRLFRSGRGQAALAWAERALERRGASFIIAARYIPVGRVAVNMTAGAVGFPRRRFTFLAAIAAVTWACYSTVIGVSAGAAFRDHSPLWGVVVGVVGGVVIGVVVDWALRRWLSRADPDGAAILEADESPAPTDAPPAPADEVRTPQHHGPHTR